MTLPAKLSEMDSKEDQLSYDHAKQYAYPRDEWAQRDFRHGFRAALALPEVQQLVEALQASYDDYIKYADHDGAWDSEGVLVEHFDHCLKCKMEKALTQWSQFTKGEVK